MAGDFASPPATEANVPMAKMRSMDSASAAPVNAHLASRSIGSAPSPQVQRQIVRHAELALRVKAIEAAERKIDQLVSSEQGYVDSASSTDLASDHPQMQLTLRVPVATFDASIAQFEALGTRLSKTVGSEDVTGQLIDMDARLRTMAAEESTYQGLLKQAHSLQTVIAIRDKLSDLRSQIESIGQQRKTMGELATLSTITVSLTQDAVAAAAATDRNWVNETWGQASMFAVSTAMTLVSILIWLVALSPFWIPALVAGRRFVSKYRTQTATSRVPGSTIL